MDKSIAKLKAGVQRNCNISDAGHAGLFSLCGLLLRLRDLFKWEKGLAPWEEPEPADLMEWVDEREELWETIAHEEFEAIELAREALDPFDTERINRLLQPMGLAYGAGYAIGMKPSFFLGHLEESRGLGPLQVDVIGAELARDIFITPVMRQGCQVFARRSAMLFVIWDHVLEMRPSVRDALAFALSEHGLNLEEIRSAPGRAGFELNRVAAQELETWIYHEVGEFHEDVFSGQVWHEIVSSYSNSPIEIYARVVKDILADTHPEGLLSRIVGQRISSSLGFYIVNARAFMRLLFPEILEAFCRFRKTGDWGLIEGAREIGHDNGSRWARTLTDLHLLGLERGQAWARDRIMAELIEPLGIGRGSAPVDED